MRTGLLIFLLSLTFWACHKGPKGDTQILPEKTILAKGADVSWITEQEKAGVKFYNNSGLQQDIFQVLKAKGINSIRLRVWVNPADGYCNLDDVLAKAERASKSGMRLMIDFHYSDSWADPGKQTKPSAWSTQNVAGLKQSVYDHTFSVLTALKSKGIIPEWVQVGNETNDGMLWEEGKASKSMKNFAEMVLAGYDAAKSVDNKIKVIVHISNGYDNTLFRWIFDGLKNNGAKWDVIGMSLYPTPSDWTSKNMACLENMKDMIARYGSEVMICEVGMPVSEATACKSFITDLLAKVKSLSGNKGLGVFYWEPQSYNSWKGYKLGAFDDSGKPTVAMDAFLN